MQLSELVPAKWKAAASDIKRYLDAFPVVVVCPWNERKIFCHNKKVLSFADILPQAVHAKVAMARPYANSSTEIFKEIFDVVIPGGIKREQEHRLDTFFQVIDALEKSVLVLDDFDLIWDCCLDRNDLTAKIMKIMARGFPNLTLVIVTEEDVLQSIKQTYTSSERRFKELRPDKLVLSEPEKHDLLVKLYPKMSDQDAKEFFQEHGGEPLYEFTYNAYCRFGI